MARKTQKMERIKSELDLDEDIELQETAFKLQRIGFVFIYLLVFIAALGLFGNGLMSTKTIKHENGEVKFERFYRHEAEMQVKVSLNNANDSIATISFPNKYLEKFKVESIFPEPKENKVMGDHVQYIFSGSDHMNIVFHLAPQKTGSVSGILKINNVDYSIKHFIYP